MFQSVKNENLKSSPSGQLRMITPPTTWVVAKVQVYPVAVEVVRRLNDIIFPEKDAVQIYSLKICLKDLTFPKMKILDQKKTHLNVLLPPVPPTALLLLTPAAAFTIPV